MSFWRPGNAGPNVDREDNEIGNNEQGRAIVFNSNARLPLAQQRALLPVSSHRMKILYALEKYQTIIIVGETGSGKTTQIPQYLLEGGWAAENRMIVCTQPRKIAVTTISARVAEERGCVLGSEIGYAVRFDEKWNRETTRLKFCTDGMLLRETMIDPLLSKYSVIMLDEAHERSVHTDILLGLMKKIQRKRKDLRVIVSSATLEAQKIRQFFEQNRSKDTEKNTTTIISVEGRQHSVDVEYLEKPTGNYLEKTIETVLNIHTKELPGDVLVFLPGREDINHVVEAINDRSSKLPRRCIALPLYSTLPKDIQEQAFLPAQRFTRKIVVATTIAETSVTIDNIVYVVDCGFVKLPFYNPIIGMESLITTPTSQAASIQRAGRAGRVKPGKCFRLMTQKDFKNLSPSTLPDIQRTDLTWVLLQLKALGIDDVLHFDFLSAPPAESVIRALELLYALGVLDDNCNLIEPRGTQLAEFPVEPRIAMMLLSSFQFGCTEEILTIAAMLSVQDAFMTVRGSNEMKAKMHEALGEFAAKEGDHLTMLNVYEAFLENNKSSQWCQTHFINYRALCRAVEIRRQLKQYVKRFCTVENEISHCGEDQSGIRKSIVSGFFSNAAKLDINGCYRTIKDGRLVQVHPSSVYYHLGNAPEWIVFHQVVLTTEELIRDITSIDPRWLGELAPGYFEYKDKSHLSGSSGEIGIPGVMKRKFGKNSYIGYEKKVKIEDNFPKLPIHIGKSKGGLRSQF